MGLRSELQAILEAIPGVAKVYFQPPQNVKLVYPAIVYNRESSDTVHADNNPYRRVKRYMVTVIDQNPDSTIPDVVEMLPMCSHRRFYAVDQLNHDVFDLYF